MRDGISFARQPRFLSVQVAYYLALGAAVLALLLLFAAGLVHAFSSNGVAAAIASAEKMVLRFALIALAAGALAWLAAKWLSLYFISSAAYFFSSPLGKHSTAATADKQAVKLAASRFVPFVKASLLMGAVFLLGALFFFLLGSSPLLENAASLLSSLYALFFSLAFLFAPFHLALGGKGVWQALSASFDSLRANPLRAFLLFIAAEIVEAVALALSAVPLVLAVAGLLWAFAAQAGFLALVLLAALLLLSLALFAAGIAFGNLAAIGMYCSAFLEAQSSTRKKLG